MYCLVPTNNLNIAVQNRTHVSQLTVILATKDLSCMISDIFFQSSYQAEVFTLSLLSTPEDQLVLKFSASK